LAILGERTAIFFSVEIIRKGIAHDIVQIEFGLHNFYCGQLQYKMSILSTKSSKSQFYKKQLFFNEKYLKRKSNQN
jgi:hypothetical protein